CGSKFTIFGILSFFRGFSCIVPQLRVHSSLSLPQARTTKRAHFLQLAFFLASEKKKNFNKSVRSPRVRTITFLSCVCYIYLDASVQYRTLVCVATSSSIVGLICSFCPSDREFACGFLQIPPHGGHPCLRLTLPTVMACSGLAP